MRTRAVHLLCAISFLLPAVAFAPTQSGQNNAKRPSASGTRSEGLAAWQQVYSVLRHPRCINCHTATN